jgi:leucyl aminopeptidase
MALLLLVCLLTLPASAVPRDDEVWITIEREKLTAFEAVESGSPIAGEAPATEAPAHAASPASREIVAVPFSERRILALAMFMHERYRVCGGFIAHPSPEAAWAEVARASAEETAQAPAPPTEYTIDNGPVVEALLAEVKETNIRNTIGSLESFFTRYHACHSTYHSADWIKTLWESYAAGRRGVTVEFVNHSTTPQPSVVLTIPAATSAGTVETGIVVLGAHQDSVAGSSCTTSRSPGADDDGSGVAALSEVIRATFSLGYHPQKTVKFMAYAAEEVGLRGSDDIAERHLQQGANVVGVLQLDMTNYKGSVADIYIYTDSTNPAQNAFLGQLADTYLPGVTRGTGSCGYGCSDHASWASRGYPASFPFEAVFGQHDPFIHTSNDTLANMGGNANQTLKFTKLAAAYMAELAKGGFRADLELTDGASVGAGTSAPGSGPAARR